MWLICTHWNTENFFVRTAICFFFYDFFSLKRVLNRPLKLHFSSMGALNYSGYRSFKLGTNNN